MSIIKDNNCFFLETKKTSYIFDIYNGYLRHIYFGKKIVHNDFNSIIKFHRTSFLPVINDEKNIFASLDSLSQEYGLFAVGDFRESSLVIRDINGCCSCDLKFYDYKIFKEKPVIKGVPQIRKGETLCITLKDNNIGIKVDLYYTVIPEFDSIIRRAEISNFSENKINIFKAYSFSLDIHDKNYKLISLTGKHSSEANINCENIYQGKKVFNSVRGASSHQCNPFIAISEKGLDEFYGETIGFNLIYSGSFSLCVEKNQLNDLRICGGINETSFNWNLYSNESFSTPEVAIVFSENGLNGMSENFHGLYRNYLINNKFVYAERPIVANTWESMQFDFNNDKIFKFIDSLSETGVDTFVVDDGWFCGRNNDESGLGDWTADNKKLVGGLKPIIDYCKNKGLKFGLWIEPEMISKNSKLYADNKNWVISAPNRNPSESRHQLVLDLTNPEVIEYLYKAISNLLLNNEIDYIKWDMNRFITENYSNYLPCEKQGEFSHRYILGLYSLLEKITTNFPDLFIESCAGGGGRFDAGMLYYSPQIWASDATCANERTKIQYGFSLCYPLSSISAHFSDVPNIQNERTISVVTRANIAMVGTFGYEIDFLKIDNRLKNQLSKITTQYKKISSLIREGKLIRITNPQISNNFDVMVINNEKTFAFFVHYQRLTSNGLGQDRIYFKGLDENKLYKIEELNITAKGSTLINMGIEIDNIYKDFESVLLLIKSI